MGCLYQDGAAWRAYFDDAKGQAALAYLYPDTVAAEKARYMDVAARFSAAFGESAFAFLSAPGRTELLGNHTDHQRGRVLAASVSMDMLAVAAKNELGRMRMLSEGYDGMMEVALDMLNPRPEEKNTTAALMRGVAAGVKRAGYEIGGVDLYVASNVPRGSGLSSSAAIEVLIGTAFNALYNGMGIPPVKIAQIGQYAENEYFMKPCGLMDQMACSVGGVVAIDFLNRDHPDVERMPYHMEGYTICIVDAGGSHAHLTEEYASIPEEMRMVARALGHDVLGEVKPADFFAAIPALRLQVCDRAILRAIHFFEENERVLLQKAALLSGDKERYRVLMQQSGYSSFTQLQNIYPSNSTKERSVALALSLSHRLLEGRGAWRVHGGGMAGTIQALVPDSFLAAYRDKMEAVFGGGCCYALSVRPVGGWAIGNEQHLVN